jgi:hypothetical protein
VKNVKPDVPRDEAVADGYVLAASVLDTFQPERLQPVGGFERDLGKLLDISVMSKNENGMIEWRLPNDIRRSALQTLAKQNSLRHTLEANKSAADVESPYQVMFEKYVTGGAGIPLERQSLEELQASLNAVRLLEGLAIDLPDADQVRGALHRQGFIHQFELLADNHFVGREGELRQLRDFVDVLFPTSILTKARRASTNILGSMGLVSILHEEPLLLTGMGGMGKSALLSKFLLEHLHAEKSPDLLFAYVDFDKPAIWPDQPMTVLAEIAQQLALQVPAHATKFQGLSSQLVAELSMSTAYASDFDSFEAFGSIGTHGQRLESAAIEEFASICQSALKQASRRTLLLVFDTFEEVSQRSVWHQQHLLQFVGQLQHIMPRLRVVISGRGMHPDSDEAYATGIVDQLAKAVKPLELEELSEDESCHLLESLGSSNQLTNKAIVRRVGGHPLSLRLAAQLVATVAQRLGRSATELTSADLFGKEWLDHMSEGVLYRRIIAHIPDEPLKKLANPGLVLREITADIIFNVLNEPCELGLQSRSDADALFNRLKQFNQLVSIQGHHVLRHRPELRQRLLNELRHGQPQLCREIWSRAAHDYMNHDYGRAEELYCRLMLDEPTERLAERWQSGLEKSLLRSRSEMPVRARQFLDLMALMADGRSLSDLQVGSDLDQALLAEEMKLLLSRGSAKEALNLFRATSSGRVPRFDSVLYSVHVRAIAQSGDLDKAMAMALTGLDRLEDSEKAGSPRYDELLLLCCQVTQAQHNEDSRPVRLLFSRALRRSKPLQAGELWRRFLKVDLSSERHVLVLRIAVALLELFDMEGVGGPDAVLSESKQANSCAKRALGALRRLRPDYFGVDGGLLLRSMAWLCAYVGPVAEIKELLGVPHAITVLRSDYQESLKEYLAIEGTELEPEFIALMSYFSKKKNQPQFFGPDWLTDEQMTRFCSALLRAIRARDQTLGSRFS